MYNTPILILGFNRPKHTQKVFDRIRVLKPQKLFVAIDGPRIDKNEKELCDSVLKIFETQIDWTCDLKTLVRKQNLGCRNAVFEAINWFFSHVPEGIILEDDCVPTLTFFDFCTELLSYYREDKRVMHIGGYRPKDIPKNQSFSYSFSKQVLVWGWASWAEVWNKYMDIDMLKLGEYLASNRIKNFIGNSNAQHYIKEKWGETFEKRNTSWAYAWGFSIAYNDGVSIVPSVNLISNVGFGDEATNTKVDSKGHIENSVEEMNFPLIHPPINNEMSIQQRELFEQAIFYKTQKSKWGMVIRRWVPSRILVFMKQFLDYIK